MAFLGTVLFPSSTLLVQSRKVRNKVYKKNPHKVRIQRQPFTKYGVTYLFNPLSSTRCLTAPTLVHTSLTSPQQEADSALTSNPIPLNRPPKATPDSLLVLLQNLNGGAEAACLSRCRASTAPGVGVSPICRVPERSMRIARINGRGIHSIRSHGVTCVDASVSCDHTSSQRLIYITTL